MVGFDKAMEKDKTLNDLPVAEINPDLTSLSDLTTALSLPENLKLCLLGRKNRTGCN